MGLAQKAIPKMQLVGNQYPLALLQPITINLATLATTDPQSNASVDGSSGSLDLSLVA
jgi:hypothetical protein